MSDNQQIHFWSLCVCVYMGKMIHVFRNAHTHTQKLKVCCSSISAGMLGLYEL